MIGSLGGLTWTQVDSGGLRWDHHSPPEMWCPRNVVLLTSSTATLRDDEVTFQSVEAASPGVRGVWLLDHHKPAVQSQGFFWKEAVLALMTADVQQLHQNCDRDQCI